MLQYHHLLDVILFVKHKFASCERARGWGGQRGERLLKSGMFCYLSLFMLLHSRDGGLPLALHFKTPLVCLCNIFKHFGGKNYNCFTTLKFFIKLVELYLRGFALNTRLFNLTSVSSHENFSDHEYYCRIFYFYLHNVRKIDQLIGHG